MVRFIDLKTKLKALVYLLTPFIILVVLGTDAIYSAKSLVEKLLGVVLFQHAATLQNPVTCFPHGFKFAGREMVQGYGRQFQIDDTNVHIVKRHKSYSVA